MINKIMQKEDFPSYNPDQDPDTLPFIEGSDEVRQIRFDWDVKEGKKHLNNSRCITIVTNAIFKNWRNYGSVSEKVMGAIRYSDMYARVATRFNTMKKK